MNRHRVGLIVAGVLVAVCALAPWMNFNIGILSSEVSSPGSLQVLGISIIYAGYAVSYDLLFGYTGQLSFGHALPIALGVYGTNLIMLHVGVPYAAAVVLALVGNVVVAAILGAITLRVTGVGFTMVTLAFAEAFAILVLSDPFDWFGGEEGIPLASDQVPDMFRGVVNARNLYWLALVGLVVTYLVADRVVGSRAGRVWKAIRENEPRVHMVGLEPFRYKLAAFVLASALASVLGSVYLLLVRGANTGVTTPDFTLGLLVMVVLGGGGRLWGAALGGFVYSLLNLRLGDVSTSETIDGLPQWLAGPLSEPMFILGVLFVILVLYAPGGLSSIIVKVAGRFGR